ncbi:MAG TPA: alpha/beta hydrolase [Polyangia bacterium]|nr:alpha/beta hydrolase [Polyangia bacterium]
MSIELRFVEANGLRFAYLEEGAGPLALLLHGFPDTARTWDDVRPRLAARGWRAVSPFMRGYHPTQVPARDADLETIARDALALIEALGESSAVVIGHDWGATAAYGAAAIAPARVRKLFTIAIPHPATLRPTPSKLWGVRHFAAYRMRGAPARFARDDFAALAAIYRRWSPEWNPPPEELAAVRECFSRADSLDAAFGYYRTLGLRVPAHLQKKIEVPTVVFAGASDPVARPDDYRRAARMFTAGYTVEELGGGHFLHREHPREFAERLLAHL